MQDFTDNAGFVLPIVVGLVALLVSWLTLRYPPKKINMLYGYRTARSMRSQEHWDKAQRLASRYFAIAGLVLVLAGIAIGVAGHSLSDKAGAGLAVGLVLAALLTPIYLIEKKLK